MKFLFLDIKYPEKFISIMKYLSLNPECEIAFLINENEQKLNLGIENIKIYNYGIHCNMNLHHYLRTYYLAIMQGQAALEKLISMKKEGYVPDIIFANSWGNSMFIKNLFPDIPLISYFEWFYTIDNYFGSVNKKQTQNEMAIMQCWNTPLLHNLLSCDVGICPTERQKQQFPKEFQHKLNVIPDGIDTNFYKPNNNDGNASEMQEKIVTFTINSMDLHSGFPQFMKMADKLQKKRTDVTFIVIDNYQTYFYSSIIKNYTYEKLLNEKYNIDKTRFFHLRCLSKQEYLEFLQMSSVHIYFTYPYTLSTSMLEAMSTGCIVLGSKTAPVEEVIEDNKNGFLFDFNNVDEMLEKIEYIIDNQQKLQDIRKNARKTIIEKYDINKTVSEIFNLL